MEREIFFVHINKCAGSSIEQALGLKFQHKTAIEIIDEVGRQRWQEGFSFAVVRNPWDKVVSHYHWRLKTNQTDLAVNPISFSEWVERTYGAQDVRYFDKPKMFMPQSKWLAGNAVSASSDVMVDFIGRFESLRQDFERICAIIKLDKAPQLPHMNKTKRAAYQSYYTHSTREIVSRWFAEDIERFGYNFRERPLSEFKYRRL